MAVRSFACLAFGVGVYFHAPWKILTLTAIFLAAHTVFPKRFRKKFWAGVGIVALALTVWIFLPEDNNGWEPYIFNEELTSLETKRSIPNEENACDDWRRRWFS